MNKYNRNKIVDKSTFHVEGLGQFLPQALDIPLSHTIVLSLKFQGACGMARSGNKICITLPGTKDCVTWIFYTIDYFLPFVAKINLLKFKRAV